MSEKYYVYYIICIIFNLSFINSYEIIIPFFSKLSQISKDLTPLKFIEALIINNL